MTHRDDLDDRLDELEQRLGAREPATIVIRETVIPTRWGEENDHHDWENDDRYERDGDGNWVRVTEFEL